MTDELGGGDFTVVEGLDRFLFLGTYAGADVMRQFTDADGVPSEVYEYWSTALPRWREDLEQRGIAFLTLVVPDAHLVYSDKLPRGTTPTALPPYRRIETLLDEATRARCVYALDDLVAGRSEHDTYQTTDSHWSDFGAYLGYRTAMKALSAQMPGVEILPADRLEWTDRRSYGALGVRMPEERSEQLRVAQIRDSRCRPTFNVTTDVRDGYVVVEQDRVDLPTAVVFRDSFMTNAAKYFSESFRRTVYVTHPNRLYFDLVDDEKPDVVIFQAAERRLCIAATEPPLMDFRMKFGDLLLDDPAAVRAQVASRSFLRANELAQALAANDEVLALVPPTARLMMYRSQLLSRLGNDPAALDALRAAFVLDPLDAPVGHALARSLGQQGLLVEAAAASRWSAGIEPHHPEFWTLAIGAALRADDVDGANTLAREALEHHPHDHLLHYLRSVAAVRSGDSDAAETSARAAVAARPEDGTYLRQLTSVLIRAEKWNEARHHLARLTSLEPTAPELKEYVTLVEHRLGAGGRAAPSR